MTEENEEIPETIGDAVDKLIADLTFREKSKIASLDESELIGLHLEIGTDLRNRLKLWYGNDNLMEACRKVSDKKEILPEHASFIILMELWEKLQNSNVLRLVKK